MDLRKNEGGEGATFVGERCAAALSAPLLARPRWRMDDIELRVVRKLTERHVTLHLLLPRQEYNVTAIPRGGLNFDQFNVKVFRSLLLYPHWPLKCACLTLHDLL